MFGYPVRLHKWLKVMGVALLVLALVTVIATMVDLPIDNEIYDIITSGKLTQKSAYQQIFKTLARVSPINKCPAKLDNYPNGRAKEKFSTDPDIFSRDYLNSRLQIDDLCLEELSKSHDGFMKFIESTDIEFGDLSTASGDGIVMVGGGKFNVLTLLNVQWLKILKSELPIEVFIGNKEEYDEHFCNDILPKFGDNVKCTLVWEHISEGLFSKFNIRGFQYKTLALLISSFENILFLDADNMPVKAPDALFTSEVFQKTGLVIWPDVWARTTSPKYYENILHNKIGDKPIRGEYKEGATEFNYHDFEGTVPNPTTESGMMLVNKKLHSKTLLLALYYNIFGPSYYYPLFTQGSAGEGDKETFINAATVLKANYYQLKKRFTFIGYTDESGFHSKALGQHDPIVDYANSLPDSTNEKPGVMFMHLSYPKLIPDLLIEKKELKNEKTGKHRKLYPGSGLDYNFELQINEVFVQLLCTEYDGSDDVITVVSKGIGSELNMFDIKKLQKQCEDYFIPHVKFLKENP